MRVRERLQGLLRGVYLRNRMRLGRNDHPTSASDAILIIEIIVIIPAIAVMAAVWTTAAKWFPAKFGSNVMPDLITLAVSAAFWFGLEVYLSKLPIEPSEHSPDACSAGELSSYWQLLSKWITASSCVIAVSILCVALP